MSTLEYTNVSKTVSCVLKLGFIIDAEGISLVPCDKGISSVFQNMARTGDEVTGGWGKLHNQGLYS
jgi:hypothetical protein